MRQVSLSLKRRLFGSQHAVFRMARHYLGCKRDAHSPCTIIWEALSPFVRNVQIKPKDCSEMLLIIRAIQAKSWRRWLVRLYVNESCAGSTVEYNDQTLSNHVGDQIGNQIITVFQSCNFSMTISLMLIANIALISPYRTKRFIQMPVSIFAVLW